MALQAGVTDVTWQLSAPPVSRGFQTLGMWEYLQLLEMGAMLEGAGVDAQLVVVSQKPATEHTYNSSDAFFSLSVFFFFWERVSLSALIHARPAEKLFLAIVS